MYKILVIKKRFQILHFFQPSSNVTETAEPEIYLFSGSNTTVRERLEQSQEQRCSSFSGEKCVYFSDFHRLELTISNILPWFSHIWISEYLSERVM